MLTLVLSEMRATGSTIRRQIGRAVGVPKEPRFALPRQASRAVSESSSRERKSIAESPIRKA
jgi:hypothetical protein